MHHEYPKYEKMTIHKTTSSLVNTTPETQSLSLFDADALSDAVRSSSFEHVQIERGEFRADLKHIDVGRLTIDSGRYTRKLIARGEFPPGKVILGCVLDSREEGCINGYRFRLNDVVIYPEGSELHYILPAATSWCAIQLSETLLLEAGCTEMRPDRVKVLPGNRQLAQLMSRLVNSYTPHSEAGTARSGQSTQLNEETLLDQIRYVFNDYYDDCDKVRSPNLHNRMAMVRLFEHKVRERIDKKVRIPELCNELAVSERVLEYRLKEATGMTPKQYLNVLRLNSVRKELLKRNTDNRTINQIARHFGISHLGRFAAAYHRQFGERPSDTLRRE